MLIGGTTNIETLIERLLEYAEWVDANEWEAPLCFGDDLRETAEYIKQKEMIESDDRK